MGLRFPILTKFSSLIGRLSTHSLRCKKRATVCLSCDRNSVRNLQLPVSLIFFNPQRRRLVGNVYASIA